MRSRHMMMGIALTLATTFAWAQSPGPAPTNAPPVAKPDPLAGYITPGEWLKAQPKPTFKEGHTLPPLTRYGWCLDFDTRVEFAEKWGYCLEFGGGYLSHAVVDRVLGNPNDPEAKVLALAAKDPKKYKLAVITSRDMPPKDKLPPETWCRDADGKLLTGQAKSQDGTAWTPGVDVQWSPAAPVSAWEEVAKLRSEPLRRLREKCPIAIVLNGGEEGLPVAGWGQKVWEKDPAICKDNVALRKEFGRVISWAEYVSARGGRVQNLFAGAIRKAVPDRILYVLYTIGGNAGPWDWAPGYKDMKETSDLPCAECYYMHFNSGWMGDQDQLTKLLQAKAYEIAGGQPLSYNWLSGGPTGVGASRVPTSIPLFTGFLKCCYTAGMIGGNAGYYDYPRYKDGRGGFDAKFPPDQPPPWILQMMALGQVHAQFSHLEHYLRQGDLVAGPYVNAWATDQPAYELLPVELAQQAETKYPIKTEVKDEAGWEKTDFNDAAWKNIELPQKEPKIFEFVAGWQQAEGVIWFRKTVEIPPALAGKDLVLKLASCDDNDITYWNGEKIGQTQCWGAVRKYKIPADKVKAGQAVVAVRVEDWWGGGGIAIVPGKAEELSLSAADGSNPISLAGPWKHAIAKVVLADKSGKPEYSRLPPGRPVRVLARKLRDKPQWLITVWAADGKDRAVKVPVPDLGEVTLQARAEANVYEATLKDGKQDVKLVMNGGHGQ